MRRYEITRPKLKKVVVVAEETPEFQVVAKEFKEFNDKMRDPLVVGAMLNRLSEERRSTNLLLKEIHEKLERITSRLGALEENRGNSPKEAIREIFLSDVDERMVAFVKSKGRANAEEVQKEFGYKNRNAASARLNALWKQGVMTKKLAGRTAFFTITLIVPKAGPKVPTTEGSSQDVSFD